MTAPDVLVVATTRRWMADDLTIGAAGRLPVLHSWGYDIPHLGTATQPAWWTPLEHAARLLRAGAPAALLTPGPAWLSTVDRAHAGRTIWTGRLDAIDQAPTYGWAKAAELKREGLDATWYDHISDFASAATAAGLSGDSMVQVSPTRLELELEHRFFIVHGAPVTGSPYLVNGTTWSPGLETDPTLRSTDARAFAIDVAAAMIHHSPRSYTLDVGRIRSGRWVVIEANPTFSSALYGSDLEAAATAVLTATSWDSPASSWSWTPDPYLVRRAERAAPLAFARPLAPLDAPLINGPARNDHRR